MRLTTTTAWRQWRRLHSRCRIMLPVGLVAFCLLLFFPNVFYVARTLPDDEGLSLHQRKVHSVVKTFHPPKFDDEEHSSTAPTPAPAVDDFETVDKAMSRRHDAEERRGEKTNEQHQLHPPRTYAREQRLNKGSEGQKKPKKETEPVAHSSIPAGNVASSSNSMPPRLSARGPVRYPNLMKKYYDKRDKSSVTLPPRESVDSFDDLNKRPNKLIYRDAKTKKQYYFKEEKMNLFSKESNDNDDNTAEWQNFTNNISNLKLYHPDDPLVDIILRKMATEKFDAIHEPDSGTQVKLFVSYPSGMEAILKPQREPRERAAWTDPNQFYFSEFEKHHAEIAAYHLDRVLGFNRVPPCVGRFVNITSELEPIAENSFKKTIFTSPGGNKCFHGNCEYYCQTGFSVCADPELLETSLCALIPAKSDVPRSSQRNPYRRSYSKFKMVDWQTNDRYCEKVSANFSQSRMLLDLMDVHIFDYFSGNQDRHHFERFQHWGNQTYPILFDNGRGFGRPYYDDPEIILPLKQCCLIRHSTLQRLRSFLVSYKQTGAGHLSQELRKSLKNDPIDKVNPILTEFLYEAIDRRLVDILETVRDCVQRFGYRKVVWDDKL